jgi:hypothetical protein
MKAPLDLSFFWPGLWIRVGSWERKDSTVDGGGRVDGWRDKITLYDIHPPQLTTTELRPRETRYVTWAELTA